MKPEELKQLYNEVIMRHQKDPYHFEKREGEPSLVASNPMCGDTFSIYLEEGEETIEGAWFHGLGCALSKASASILMRDVEGKNKEEVLRLCRDFLLSATGEKNWEGNEEAGILAELRNHGGRMDCITLAWKALDEYLEER